MEWNSIDKKLLEPKFQRIKQFAYVILSYNYTSKQTNFKAIYPR